MTEIAAARLAATVLIVRDGERGLEVFMVKRHRQIDFASGALVFPGGAVDAADSRVPAPGDYSVRERAMRVAAIRETFEESGVLLARELGGSDWVSGERAAALGHAAAGLGFAELVERERLELGLDALTPFAHWITPESMPKRFDTQFYIVAAPADQHARHDGHESVDSVWIEPTRALEQAAKGVYTIVPATRLNVEMLARSADVAQALAAAAAREIVTVQPVAERTETGLRLSIPIEAGYGVDHFLI